LIKSLIVAYNLLKASAIVAGIASAFALNPLLGVGSVALAAGVLAAANALTNNDSAKINNQIPETKSFSSISGVLGIPTPTVTPPVTPKIIVPTSSGGGVAAAATSAAVASTFASTLSQGEAIRRAEMANPTVNLTVNQGIVGDPESAARSVVDVLNRSFFRGTNGANALLFG